MAGMFTEDQLEQEVALWCGARESVELRHPGFLGSTKDSNLRVKRIANELIKICINDLISASATGLAASGVSSPGDAARHTGRLITHSPAIRAETAELQKFLHARFYRHPHLIDLTAHASEILKALFEAYVDQPSEMTPWFQRWVEDVGLHRAVCDYLAGMTDRFVQQEHMRLVAR